MPSPTLEDRLQVLETLEPASRGNDGIVVTHRPRRWGRSVLAGAALTALLVGGVLVAGSGGTSSPQAPAASSTAAEPEPAPEKGNIQVTPLEPATIDAKGFVALPDPPNGRLEALNAVVDDCMTENGATRVGEVLSATSVYDDPTGKATTACAGLLKKRNAFAEVDQVAEARERRVTLQRAYAACVLAEPDATPADVEAVAASPTGVACRNLLNPVAWDVRLLAAIVSQTELVRDLDDDGHFTLAWAARTTRERAAQELGIDVPSATPAKREVIALVFDGAFASGDSQNRSRVLKRVIDIDPAATVVVEDGGDAPFVTPTVAAP